MLKDQEGICSDDWVEENTKRLSWRPLGFKGGISTLAGMKNAGEDVLHEKLPLLFSDVLH